MKTKRALYFANTLMLATAVSTLGACSYGYPKQHNFDAPPPSFNDWKKVLAHPSTITLNTIQTGTVTVPRSGVINLEDPAAKGLSDDEFEVGVFAHWIHHPVYGDYLIDTGFNRRFIDDPDGDIEGVLSVFFWKGAQLQPGRDIRSQVDSHGLKLRGIFFTHLHQDHTAGVVDLPKDIQFIAGKDGTYHNYRVLLHADHLADVHQLDVFDFAQAAPMAPFDAAVDVFGDGSLWAMPTPGHCRGHVSYLVNSQTGPVLLAGDASHTKWGFEHGVAPGWADDEEAAQRSLTQLIAFKKEFPQTTVFYGHERP